MLMELRFCVNICIRELVGSIQPVIQVDMVIFKFSSNLLFPTTPFLLSLNSLQVLLII